MYENKRPVTYILRSALPRQIRLKPLLVNTDYWHGVWLIGGFVDLNKNNNLTWNDMDVSYFTCYSHHDPIFDDYRDMLYIWDRFTNVFLLAIQIRCKIPLAFWSLDRNKFRHMSR